MNRDPRVWSCVQEEDRSEHGYWAYNFRKFANMKLQLPHFREGVEITPNAGSAVSAFNSTLPNTRSFHGWDVTECSTGQWSCQLLGTGTEFERTCILARAPYASTNAISFSAFQGPCMHRVDSWGACTCASAIGNLGLSSSSCHVECCFS